MKAKALPPLDELRAAFSYNPETGELTRTINNKVVNNKPEKGYHRIRIKRVGYSQSRICWALFYGEDPVGYEIDHINRDPGDNRIDNLRKVMRDTNNQNRVLPLPSTGHRNITKKVCKGITYFVVRINGRWIGQRKTIPEAIELRDQNVI